MTPLLRPVWCLPGRSSLSRTATRRRGYRAKSSRAVASPTMPAPATATSYTPGGFAPGAPGPPGVASGTPHFGLSWGMSMTAERIAPFKNEPIKTFADSADAAKMETALTEVRKEFGREYPLVIDGERISTPKKIASRNPADPDQ